MADKKNNETDRLRALLRQVELPSPPAGFTDEVMNETALREERISSESHLKTVLREITLHEPPSNFTYNVEKAIRERSIVQSKPVITKGAWIVIGLFLAACIAFPILYPSTSAPTKNVDYFSWLAVHVVHFAKAFRESILYFEMIFLSSALLFGLERILRRVQWKQN